MMETRLIPKKFLKLIKNLADENRNYKKIFGNVFWLEVVKEKNYTWFNLRLNSTKSHIFQNSLFPGRDFRQNSGKPSATLVILTLLK